MKFKIKYAEQIVGLFVLIAIVSLAGILIFMGINQRWFAKDYSFYSKFNSGEGLNRGMAVKLKGFTIGAVDSIDLLEDNTVQIEFHVFDTYYDRVRPNSVLELAISPIGIGGGGLLFHPGKSAAEPLEEYSYIPSTDFPEGRDLVAKGMVTTLQGEDAVSSAMNKIGPILDTTYATLKSLNSTIMTIDNTLKGTQDGPLLDVLEEMYIVLNTLDTTLNNAASITANIDDLTGQLTETQGLVKKLLDPQGSVLRVLDDDELYNNLNAIVAELGESARELSSFTSYINSQQPTITAILKEGETTLVESQDVLEGLKNNPLLRGGITEEDTTPATFRGLREAEF
jgi:phospholipid/cholesterol/gamma-HCH transport system substrate-binding protein